MENQFRDEIHDSLIKLRVNPTRRRDNVYIGCGAGFGGDRPMAAFKLLQSVKELNYLVLECLAERTLAERYKEMISGGDGYDSRISEWMQLLLPLAVERGTCIITNMGAMDPIGAQQKVLEIASRQGLDIVVAVAHEVASNDSDSGSRSMDGGTSTYLGAAPIVRCLELHNPSVIITSRVADAALFLAPMIYELGWNWNDLGQLALGALAGHLLECGCQLTGGYFMHPGDKYRDISFARLLDLSLPFAEVSYQGKVCVAKADSSGGLLNFNTCAQQLLYEVADPSAYVTPDVIIDICDVAFKPLSRNKVLCMGAKPSATSRPEKLLQLVPKECGWKGWGEISYGGYECVKRAMAAEYLVRSWMEELNPGINSCIVSYIIGLDSLKASSYQSVTSIDAGCRDIRLHMDGLFARKEDAIQFVREFTALYTNGPAGGGGISTGHKKEILLEKQLVGRDSIFWHVGARSTNTTNSPNQEEQPKTGEVKIRTSTSPKSIPLQFGHYNLPDQNPNISSNEGDARFPAPSGKKLSLYEVAHSRVGDKGNDLNFSIIPYFPSDFARLKMIISPQWVKQVLFPLLNPSPFLDPDAIQKRDEWVEENVKVEIYEVYGIHSLNVVVRDILDGGVNCSRRIDRHGKTISDIILSQQVVLP